MNRILLLFVYLLVGWLLRRSGKIPPRFSKILTRSVIYASLPALILIQIPALPELPVGWERLYPISMPWIVFGLSFLCVSFFSRFGTPWSPGARGAITLTVGLGNTSFVGFPLLEAIYGHEALGTGILIDQFGSFLILATLGTFAAGYFSSLITRDGPHGVSAKPFSVRAWATRLLFFPPFVALVFSMTMRGFLGPSGLHYPVPVQAVLTFLASLLSQLALISVGFQMRLDFTAIRRHSRQLVTGLSLRLVAVPCLIWFFFAKFLGFDGLDMKVTILESAMAPMILGGVLASDHGLEPELSNLMVAIGIPLSLLTVPIWAHLIS